MSPTYQMVNAPTASEYVRGLTSLRSRLTDTHHRLFQAHYRAMDRTASAMQLAGWASISGGYSVVNSMYGKLGHAFCDILGIKPDLRPDDPARWWAVWSRGWRTPGGFVWQMLPQVADTLEQLGWVSPAEFASPDEVPPGIVLVEGAACRVTVNAYERNPVARRICIRTHGASCCLCGFDFGAVYGAEAEGYTHVHHVRPLSEIGREYVVDPVADLRPVCPNCHAVLHLGARCRSLEEVGRLLGRPARLTPGGAPKEEP